MAKDERGPDRAVTWFVRHISWPTAVVVALAFYPVVGLILPLALGWPPYWLALTNSLGVVLAMVILLGRFSLDLDAADRRNLLDWTSNLRLVDSSEFEWLVGEMFRREGWSVRETGVDNTPDGNIDLILTKGDTRRIVQCKRWSSHYVGVDQIRMFLGTLTREHLSPDAGVFVTLSRFGEQARQEAAAANLELVDGAQLHARLENVKRVEPGPVCQSPMIFSRSDYGWWFRCSSRNCSGKRNLSDDPGRALASLLQPVQA